MTNWKLVVYVCFMTDDFVLTTRFVKNPDLSDGKATAILDCLKTVLKEIRKRWGFSHDRRQGRNEYINEEGKLNACKYTLS